MLETISVHVKYCGVLEGPGGNCWACIGTLTNATSSITRGITYLNQAFINRSLPNTLFKNYPQ